MVSMAQESESGFTGGLGPHPADLRPQRPLPSVLVVGRIRFLGHRGPCVPAGSGWGLLSALPSGSVTWPPPLTAQLFISPGQRDMPL